MNDDLRNQMRASLRQKDTGELVEIWQKHNTEEWEEETFEVIREILQERQVALPPQEMPAGRRPSTEAAGITDPKKLELKIKEGEQQLLEAQGSRMIGFWPLVIALGIMVSMAVKIPRGGLPYLLLTLAGLAYVCFNLWRIYRSNQKVKQCEARLEEYRARQAELKSRSAT